jgi:hypothetical protein
MPIWFVGERSGETLRELAADYGVAHTTLGRYFARAEIAKQLKEGRRLIRRERREAAARQAEERRLEREVRREAKRQVALEQERRLRAARAIIAAGQRRRRRSPYETWLDERDARQPLTRADLRTRSDEGRTTQRHQAALAASDLARGSHQRGRCPGRSAMFSLIACTKRKPPKPPH